MRDPLGKIPIAYKLPLGFLVVCLVVFGVGGIVLMSSARGALEKEIAQRVGERSSAVALIIERHIDLLRQRARDFASDGYIREQFQSRETSDSSNARLSRHIAVNKLPLVHTVSGIALYDVEGRERVAIPSSSVGDSTHARTTETVVGGLKPASREQAFPTFSVSTPLFSQAGSQRIGTLQLIVRADHWVTSIKALAAMPSMPLTSMRLFDPDGDSLPLMANEQSANETAGRPIERGLSSVPWRIELRVDHDDVMAPARRLRNQYLLIGLGLLLATAAVLFFPLRFLLRPLRSVADAARRMSDGDFGTRVDVEGGDEIGELSHAFNVMAAAVDDRTKQLEASAAAVRKREQDVRVERDRLGAVIHSMKDGLFILDSEGRVTLANAGARPLVGALAHDRMERLECAREAAASAGCMACLAEPDHGQQSCVVQHEGRIYDVHTTALPAAPGRDGGRLCVSRDVTERIRQQESQAHQERMAVLGEVAAVMAHELNNPLAAISMFSEMLEEQLPVESDLRDSASVIRRNVATCKRTILALLDLAARGRPEHAPFSLGDLVNDAMTLLRPIYQRAGVTVGVSSDVDDTTLVGDELRVRQVLVNLMMNAVQACADGGEVRLRLSQREDHLVVDVLDTGTGISRGDRERIFEPFFTTKGPGSGTGLGLSTSRRIVEEHGGTLTCMDVEHGAHFRIRLPRKASQAAWEARARVQAEVAP